jgi:hypothetical protein
MIGQARVGLSGWYVYPLLSTANPTTAAAALTLAATAGVVTEGTIPLYQNADFELRQIQFFDTQGTNPGQFSIKFGTPNVFFMPDFVLVPTICGQGNLVHLLPEPITFPRGSFIQVLLRNETANARTLYFAFEGINVNITG